MKFFDLCYTRFLQLINWSNWICPVTVNLSSSSCSSFSYYFNNLTVFGTNTNMVSNINTDTNIYINVKTDTDNINIKKEVNEKEKEWWVEKGFLGFLDINKKR